MKCRKSAMLLRKRWELRQHYPSGSRRGAATFTTRLTEHNHRTNLGHRVHAMLGRGVAIIDHRIHVRGVAINDHRVGAGTIMELSGHRNGRRGVDDDIVSQRRSAVCFTARVCNTAVQYTSIDMLCVSRLVRTAQPCNAARQGVRASTQSLTRVQTCTCIQCSARHTTAFMTAQPHLNHDVPYSYCVQYTVTVCRAQ